MHTSLHKHATGEAGGAAGELRALHERHACSRGMRRLAHATRSLLLAHVSSLEHLEQVGLLVCGLHILDDLIPHLRKRVRAGNVQQAEPEAQARGNGVQCSERACNSSTYSSA